MAHDHTAGEVTPAPDPAGSAIVARPYVARPGRIKTFTALQHNRNYRFLWTGNLFANAAQWLQLFTVGWLAYEISGGSAIHSGTVAAVRTVPNLVLSPWAGALADRWDRRKIAILSQLGLTAAAILFAFVVASGHLAVWHMYVYMIISGIGFTIMQPVRQALVANTVPRSDLANALALNAMSVTSMRLVGPLIGGILIETVGFKWNFFAQAGMFVTMALLLLPMRTPYREVGASRKASTWANIVAGLRYVFKDRMMRRLNLLNFVRTAAFQPLVLVLPVYTKEALHAGAGVGSTLLIGAGIGGLTATLIIASWGFFTRKGMVGLLTLMSGSVVILLLGQSHWLWLSLPLMAVMGLSQTYFIVSNQTLIQTIVPDSFRGRVASVWQYEQGLTTLSVFLISALAEFKGIGFALTAVGSAALSLSVFFMFRFKDNRKLD